MSMTPTTGLPARATFLPFAAPTIGEEEIAEVVDTLRSGWLTSGPKVKRFEEEFAAKVGAAHAIAVNSCTAALHLALEAIGLKQGQAVLVPTMTFAATAEVVRYFHAKPILVDCRAGDCNMDPVDAEAKLEAARRHGDEVVAIIPVHYGGLIGDLPALLRLARRQRLRVVEDAAHCCPSFYRQGPAAPWLPVGAETDVSCFSFYANKTLTTGEGGMACTAHDAYAERMRIMSLHGISRDAWKRFTAEGSWDYEITAPGFKYNLTDIAAAIGLHQVRKADRLHQQRTRWAARYTERLAGVEELILPPSPPDRISSWHLYVVRLRLDRLSIDRAQCIAELKRHGISTSVHWRPLHMHPYYRETYGYQPEDLPCAAALFREIITLPLYPDLTEADVDNVCCALQEVIAQHRR